MIADDLRYTDRDVRDNPGVTARVVQYLREYTGEFDFLVDCKSRVDNGDDLSVGMVRGVLNCMRNDPRVVGLPTPKGLAEDGNILEFKPKRVDRAWKSDKEIEKLVDCQNTDLHAEHGGAYYKDAEGFDGFRHCEGVHIINRDDFQVEARIKVPYILPASTGLLHKIGNSSVFPNETDEWTMVAWYMYRVYAHKFGWWWDEFEYSYAGPDLYVRTACKYPRFLKNPRLIPPSKTQTAASMHKGFCPRCFTTEEMVTL